MSEGPETGLTAPTIVRALQALSNQLAQRGIIGEICLFGGTAMMLAFNARISTKDVDAVFRPAPVIREIADQIGEEFGLQPGWLNDGVKGFIATEPPQTTADLPQFPNLRVTMPTPEYLLAMKCMAARTGEEGVTDLPDIIFLIRQLGLKRAEEALDIVAQYYGKAGIPVKTQYLIEGLFEEGTI